MGKNDKKYALENASFDDSAHDGVHAGAVATGSENSNFHRVGFPFSTGQDLARLYTVGDGRCGRK